MIRIDFAPREWRLRRPFAMARRTVQGYETLEVHVHSGGHTGRGESGALYYKGETREGMVQALEAVARRVPEDPERLAALLPPGGARCALDCALWDLRAKRSGVRAWATAGLVEPRPTASVFTLSIDTPAEMARQAQTYPDAPCLKIKVGRERDIALDLARIRAVRAVAPADRPLLVDPNASWSPAQLVEAHGELVGLGVRWVEQPCAPERDPELPARLPGLDLIADESADTADDVARLAPVYTVVNIKLTKAGGFTEALRMRRAILAAGRKPMVGCMNNTSLGLAPAVLIAQDAAVADLDAIAELAEDQPAAMRYESGRITPPAPALWG